MADKVRVISPSGVAGTIPAEKLDAALSAGYKLESESASPTGGNAMVEGAKSALSGVPGVLAGLGIGAAKGVGDAAIGAGEMVHKIPGVRPAVDALYEGRVNWTGNPLTEPLIRPRTGPSLSEQAFKEGHSAMAPTSTSQAVGKFGADVGMMALAPTSSVPAAIAGNALLAGTQTGGDPKAMAASALMSGAAQGAGKVLSTAGKHIQGTEAARVAGTRTAQAAKAAGESINDPLWMQARGINTQKYGELIRQYGLTGGKKDVDIIMKAPANQQEVLSALSNQLGKPRQLSHIWSLLAAGSAALGAVNPMNLGIAIPLAAEGIISKYPGQSAALMQKSAGPFSRAASALGSAISNQFRQPQY